MKNSINHPTYGTIECDESFWTGNKIITINGSQLTKIDRKNYVYNTEDGPIPVEVSGGIFMGTKLKINGEEFFVTPKTPWYSIIIALLPIIFVMIWGNSPTLCAIFPVIGGAIGALVTVLFAFLGIMVSVKVKNKFLKVLVQLGFAVASVLICYLAALYLIILIA